jgi:hypothetical protein
MVTKGHRFHFVDLAAALRFARVPEERARTNRKQSDFHPQSSPPG